MRCNECPRKCNVDRSQAVGFCGVKDTFRLARAALHFWEEPCISGTRGSGTVFFSGCNLRCVYCQNYPISAQAFGKDVSKEQLQKIVLWLQSEGAHNVNFVTPSHYSVSLANAVREIKPLLTVPVVLNTSGYDSVEALEAWRGVADIFLPDCKYVDAEVSQKYSGAADYFAVASKALVKMRELCPADEFDEDGLMLRGMIVRHLVLPTLTEQSVKVLRFLRDTFGTEIYVSVMGQYFPCHLAKTDARYRALNRRLSEEEYDSVLTAFDELGLENGFCQELSSEEEEYVPSFCLEGIE